MQKKAQILPKKGQPKAEAICKSLKLAVYSSGKMGTTENHHTLTKMCTSQSFSVAYLNCYDNKESKRK